MVILEECQAAAAIRLQEASPVVPPSHSPLEVLEEVTIDPQMHQTFLRKPAFPRFCLAFY